MNRLLSSAVSRSLTTVVRQPAALRASAAQPLSRSAAQLPRVPANLALIRPKEPAAIKYPRPEVSALSISRAQSTVAAEATGSGNQGYDENERYSYLMRLTHWAMAVGILGCFFTVQYKNYLPKDQGKRKGELMNLHKSFGVLMAGAIPIRILLRLTSKLPKHVPGPKWQTLGADLAHYGMYALMVILPGTGVAMGYYGGKGLPFFGYLIPGAPTPNGNIAKNAFKVHKQSGQVFEYLVPLHVAGVGFHYMKGERILSRLNIFKA